MMEDARTEIELALSLLKDNLIELGEMGDFYCKKLQKLLNVNSKSPTSSNCCLNCKNGCDELLKRINELLGECNE